MGKNQKQRHNDDKPRDIGTASASEGASMWCSTWPCAPRGAVHCGGLCRLMYMGSAFLVVVAFHLGAVARGPHAVENILAVDAVIVGHSRPAGCSCAPAGWADHSPSHRPLTTRPAAQAAFLHRDTSSLPLLYRIAWK